MATVTIVHPQDPTLIFPLVRDTLDSPQDMMRDAFLEYINGEQKWDPNTNTLFRPYEESYRKDAISSHFTEHIRVGCSQNNKPTLEQVWKSLSPDKIKSFKGIDDLRTYMLTERRAAVCNYFHVGLCIRLSLGFNDHRGPIKIIDPSAGWGCRMISAIACGGYVSEYDGYDPNKNLIEPFKQIMKTLDVEKKCRFFCEEFEKAEVPFQYYDLGLTSPPYFDLENYSNDSSSTKNFPEWVSTVYEPYLLNLHYAIRPGGKIIIYVSSYRGAGGVKIDLEKTTLDILLKKVPRGKCKLFFKGYLQTTKNNARPFFVFEVL